MITGVRGEMEMLKKTTGSKERFEWVGKAAVRSFFGSLSFRLLWSIHLEEATTNKVTSAVIDVSHSFIFTPTSLYLINTK